MEKAVKYIIDVDTTEKTISELRNILTFMNSYTQIIEKNHPETIKYEHWCELHDNLEEMASCITNYEKTLYKTE